MKRVLAVVGLVVLAAGVVAAPPQTSASRPKLSQELLIEKLGSESFAEREAAQAALERAGMAVVPALEAALQSENPEVNRRADRALAAIHRVAESRERLTPKPVRLSFRKMPLSAAVQELKKQTGIPVRLDPLRVAEPTREITCETGELPPWEAVAAFCKAAGVKERFLAELDIPQRQPRGRNYYVQTTPPPPAETVPIELVDGVAEPLPGSRSTAVRVLALPARFPAHRVNLGTGDVLFHFDVTPLPGLNWREVSAIRITRVIDCEGRRGASGLSKQPSVGFNPYEGVIFGGGMAVGWDSDLPANAKTHNNPRVAPVPIKVATLSARSLKLLEGVVVCEVSAANQPLVTIANLPANVGVEHAGPGGVTVTILEADRPKDKGPNVFKVQIETSVRAINPFGVIRMANGSQVADASHLKAFDASGKALRLVTPSSMMRGDGFTTTQVQKCMCMDGLPAKLVYTGSKPVFVEVPFKMENVPLP